MVDNDFDMIAELVCEEYKISKKELSKKGRKAVIVEARAIITYVMFKKGMKYKDIAKRFRMARTTLYNYDKKIKNLMDINDKKVMSVIDRINNSVEIGKNAKEKNASERDYLFNEIKYALQPIIDSAIERIINIMERKNNEKSKC